jgi:L-asparaginase
MNTTKRVLILHTGGTFGMMLNESGEAERNTNDDSLTHLLSYVPELNRLATLELKVLCNIDSSDCTPDLWQLLAETIEKNWAAADGFVIIHGTDTMAFSASALSFFLSDLTKPIVFTGSQRPLSELRNDARSNILDAVELATLGIPEVMILFDGTVYRGTRATKFSNEHLQAFRSHNSPILGSFGVNLRLNSKLTKQVVAGSSTQSPTIDSRIDSKVISLNCVPGAPLPVEVVEAILSTQKGIILRGFGSGTLPAQFEDWKFLCSEALKRQIPVVVTSQCSAGEVNLDAYENGRLFLQKGVISGMDMTFESICVKLMILIGREIPFDSRNAFFTTPLAMECHDWNFEA